MTLTLITAPAAAVLSAAEVKTRLRVDGSLDDSDIDTMVTEAVGHLDGAKGILNRALVTQTWALTLDVFPAGDTIDVPLPPLQSVTSIQYVDSDGVTQTWLASKYQVAIDPHRPSRILPAYGESWPSTRAVADAVTVTFVAGYGAAAAVPDAIKAAIKLMVGHRFDNRETVVIGQSIAELPMGVDSLLAPYRVRTEF